MLDAASAMEVDWQPVVAIGSIFRTITGHTRIHDCLIMASTGSSVSYYAASMGHGTWLYN